MEFRRWEELPAFMQTSQVYPYYCALAAKRGQLFWKRWLDFVLSTILLAGLSPIMAGIALWIKLDSPGPVFFRQERVTQYGRVFRIYKFRTMSADAQKRGGQLTLQNDSRITKVGAKLRGCRLDELPLLINIWRGVMSFVGTRPEVVKYVKVYTPEMHATLLLPAGVTSEASICFKDEERFFQPGEEVDKVYLQRVLPMKMAYNLKALRHFSLLGECLTMVRTFLAVL